MRLVPGTKGAVGSTYNYLAPLYNKLIEAFKDGNIQQARKLHMKSVQLVKLLFKYHGAVVCGKAIMKLVGINCGPNRLPLLNLTEEEKVNLKANIEKIDNFEYCCR